MEDALDEAASRAGLKRGYGVRRIEPQMTLAEQLLLQMQMQMQSSSWLRALGLNSAAKSVLGQSTGSGVAQWAQRLAPLDRELARWARMSAPNSVYAYCFCTVE